MNMKRTLLWSLTICLIVSFISSCDTLPNSNEILDIPDYYFENNYLNNRVDAVNEAMAECSGDFEAFFWITDIHWEPQFNTRYSPALIKYIASKTGINKVLNGGDTGDSQEVCKDAIAQLRNAIGSDNVYTVMGNHEIVNASRYESPFERVDEELRSHNNDIVYGDKNRTYFYFDNEGGKTRYIGLASFGLYINNACESCYTVSQLEWFKNIALNVKPGWTIVVFTHALYNVSCATNKMYIGPSGAQEFIDAIDNYKGNGTIACVLIGHTHRDRIHIGQTGIPYIISASDRYSPASDDIDVERIPGTISEQHFEVVVINKEKKSIKLLSIGANARNGYDNDPGDEVDVRVLNY